MTDQLTFDALARTTDPVTSRIAASVQRPTSCERDILDALSRTGIPMCGEELAALFPWRDDGTTKTALSRLAKRGEVVAVGSRVPDGKKVPQRTWRLA